MKKDLPLYEVASRCNIGPRALVRLLDAGLPHYDDTTGLGLRANLQAVEDWLRTLHQPGPCGEMLDWLEAGADWTSIPTGMLQAEGRADG